MHSNKKDHSNCTDCDCIVLDTTTTYMYYKNIGNMDVYMYGTVWIVILVRKIYSSYFYITNHLRVQIKMTPVFILEQ